MARRRIGQETLRLGHSEQRRRSSLDEIDALIDWAPITQVLSGVYAAAKGEPGWPPLALFKALLIAVWYDVSDVKLAEALDDRGSFRRFCGFSRDEPTPERTAFVRFRHELVARGLDRTLFETVAGALRSRAVTIKAGTIVDATVIRSVSEGDADAKWSGHRSRRAIHGYKAHVGADADTALVEEVAVTPGNVHDGRAGSGALPDNPGEVYADSAYRGEVFGSAVRARGGTPRIALTAMWGKPGDDTLQKLKRWNYGVQHVRCRIEKIFGLWKRSYGLCRMRWRGLTKAALQVRLTAMAYNLKRSLRLPLPRSA
ncbi:MAG: IS5 family transposase [Acetobacteraceae bacterium]|nr:IS5 family transposase [Acetobacteraceae bacterium]